MNCIVKETIGDALWVVGGSEPVLQVRDLSVDPDIYGVRGENVTVDKQLVAFRGRCPFRQYIPSKPAKYGIKIWTLCDSKSSYALNVQVYTGKAPDERPEKNQGMRVVLDLTHGLKGQNVTCDNFFTSYQLDIILDYNATKGAVDTLDQVISTYTCKRKTNRWPMILFYNILDVSAYNAFVLWREIDPDWNRNKLTHIRK
ncbi:piggyBac transposable element-derived protein 4-like [Leptodactylus fuscus]